MLVIDVRNRTDFDSQGNMPNSVNIPLHEIQNGAFTLSNAEFRSRYGIEKPGKWVRLVVSCYSGQLAYVGALHLTNLGFVSSRAYPGSFNNWISNGGAIVHGKLLQYKLPLALFDENEKRYLSF